MKYTFVGPHQESLASGQPLFYGDVVDQGALTPEDDRLKQWMFEVVEPAPPAPPEPPAPDPTPSTPEAK